MIMGSNTKPERTRDIPAAMKDETYVLVTSNSQPEKYIIGQNVRFATYGICSKASLNP